MGIDQKALAVGYDAVADAMAYGQYRAAIVAYDTALKNEHLDDNQGLYRCDCDMEAYPKHMDSCLHRTQK